MQAVAGRCGVSAGQSHPDSRAAAVPAAVFVPDARTGSAPLSEFARDLATADDKRAACQAKVERDEKEKDDIKRDAERLEAEARNWDEQSEMQMHLHHRWAQATTALQVSIALAAIAPDQEETARVRHAWCGSARPCYGRAGDAAYLRRCWRAVYPL